MKKAVVLAVLVLLCAFALSSCITGAMMLKDSWEYTLCFYVEQGDTPTEITTENSRGNTVDRPWRRHYTFLGYYTADGAQVFDAEGNQTEDFVISDDMDLYARFEAITYTVRFDPNDGTLPEDFEVPTLSIDAWELTAPVPIPTPPDPSFQFVGWGSEYSSLYTDEEGLVNYEVFTPDRSLPINEEEEEIVLVARYAKKTCEVILDYNNGTSRVTSLEIEYGTVLDLTAYLEDDTVSYYELVGWSQSPYEWVEYTEPVTGYVKLYAVWRAYKDVRFVYGTGDVRTQRIYNVNGRGTLPEATMIGHDFDGWFTTSACTGNPVADAPFYGMADTYYAKFTPIDYTLTFHTGTDEVLAPLVYHYGYTDPLPVPIRAEHVFIGWADKLDGTGRILLSLPIGTMGDLDLYAVWG